MNKLAQVHGVYTLVRNSYRSYDRGLEKHCKDDTKTCKYCACELQTVVLLASQEK